MGEILLHVAASQSVTDLVSELIMNLLRSQSGTCSCEVGTCGP